MSKPAVKAARFSLLMGRYNELSPNEIAVIKLVLNTFGLYSGNVLEEITRKETPWKEARIGYSENRYSNKIISFESMKQYFSAVDKTYPINTEDGLKKHIAQMMQHKGAACKKHAAPFHYLRKNHSTFQVCQKSKLPHLLVKLIHNA